jgi:predicted alpha/beta-hydrolase family hydrolase
MRRLAVILVMAAACGRQAEPPPGTAPEASPSPSPEATSAFTELTTEELVAMSEPVGFRTDDGLRIEGRVFGDGDTGVVLSHMSGGDQTQWWPLAGTLADEGYLTLTYNRRGSCPEGDAGCSDDGEEFSGWRDVVAAVGFLRDEGADGVVIGGASVGASESMYVAEEGLADVDGVVWVAGVDFYGDTTLVDGLSAVREPKLFLAGKDDDDLGELAAEMQRVAPPPKDLVLLDTGEHGTDILSYDPPEVTDAFRRAVLDFLAEI